MQKMSLKKLFRIVFLRSEFGLVSFLSISIKTLRLMIRSFIAISEVVNSFITDKGL